MLLLNDDLVRTLRRHDASGRPATPAIAREIAHRAALADRPGPVPPRASRQVPGGLGGMVASIFRKPRRAW